MLTASTTLAQIERPSSPHAQFYHSMAYFVRKYRGVARIFALMPIHFQEGHQRKF
jgi:hypothetical protein